MMVSSPKLTDSCNTQSTRKKDNKETEEIMKVNNQPTNKSLDIRETCSESHLDETGRNDKSILGRGHSKEWSPVVPGENSEALHSLPTEHNSDMEAASDPSEDGETDGESEIDNQPTQSHPSSESETDERVWNNIEAPTESSPTTRQEIQDLQHHQDDVDHSSRGEVEVDVLEVDQGRVSLPHLEDNHHSQSKITGQDTRIEVSPANINDNGDTLYQLEDGCAVEEMEEDKGQTEETLNSRGPSSESGKDEREHPSESCLLKFSRQISKDKKRSQCTTTRLEADSDNAPACNASETKNEMEVCDSLNNGHNDTQPSEGSEESLKMRSRQRVDRKTKQPETDEKRCHEFDKYLRAHIDNTAIYDEKLSAALKPPVKIEVEEIIQWLRLNRSLQKTFLASTLMFGHYLDVLCFLVKSNPGKKNRWKAFCNSLGVTASTIRKYRSLGRIAYKYKKLYHLKLSPDFLYKNFRILKQMLTVEDIENFWLK
jgi:hypothetical protein